MNLKRIFEPAKILKARTIFSLAMLSQHAKMQQIRVSSLAQPAEKSRRLPGLLARMKSVGNGNQSQSELGQWDVPSQNIRRNVDLLPGISRLISSREFK